MNVEAVFERLQPLVEEFMRGARVPGLCIALTHSSETLATHSYGLANLESKTPVTAATRFQIGSISKSFTAILILQLVEQGLLDLHAPVTRYLPWFRLEGSLGTITVHHLLTHTAGLIAGDNATPDSLYAVASLRNRSPVWNPGERFSYSNVAYKTLGAILERVHRQPLDRIIRTRILEPLEMRESFPIITQANRIDIATGYTNQFDDRPAHSSHALVPATFSESDQGDGSIVATPEDLCAYARMLLRRGAPLISDSSFQLMTAAHATRNILGTPESSYGYGLALTDFFGVQTLWHSGGMIGFSSALFAMPELELGMVIFRNSSVHSMVEFSQSALEVVCKTATGLDLEPKPKRSLTEFASSFESEHGRLEFVQEGDGLRLSFEQQSVALEKCGEDSLCTNHKNFELFPFEFSRDESGKIVEVFHGSSTYWNSSYCGEKDFVFPEHWLALPGYYRSHNPWVPCFRVVLRKGELYAIADEFGSVKLEPDGDEFVLHGTPERLRFDFVLEGLAQRADLSGCDYVRIAARENG